MKWRILVPTSFLLTFLLALATRQVINYMAENQDERTKQSALVPSLNPTLASQRGIPLNLEWSSDDEMLLIQTTTGIWMIENGSQSAAPYRLIDSEEVTSYAVHPTKNRMIVGYADGRLRLWEYTSTSVTLQYDAESEPNAVQRILWSPDGTHVLNIYENRRVLVWNATDLTEIGYIEANGEAPLEVLFNHDGSLILARYGSEDVNTGSLLVFYDSATGERLEAVGSLDEPPTIKQLIYSPDGEWLAVVVSPSKVQLWDAVTLQIAGEFDVGEATAGDLEAVFSPDGRVLIVAQRSDAKSPVTRVTQLNVAISRIINITEYATEIYDMGWRADGTQLTLLGEDGLIYRWNRVNESELPPLSQFYSGE
jgi:WD40 repeat protein